MHTEDNSQPRVQVNTCVPFLPVSHIAQGVVSIGERNLQINLNHVQGLVCAGSGCLGKPGRLGPTLDDSNQSGWCRKPKVCNYLAFDYGFLQKSKLMNLLGSHRLLRMAAASLISLAKWVIRVFRGIYIPMSLWETSLGSFVDILVD